ncbi:hypothetical protein POM88_033108 [Heracleum sosnowskyi]|uniref:Uncharacterized protein n=1 Tax=Heracleum sosnowskyi TaxID=360622 RepID=A0AAD8I3K3_9APIA|nr:hypothetical protein POM88_033108 [Heracleum sosnowskyi]
MLIVNEVASVVISIIVHNNLTSSITALISNINILEGSNYKCNIDLKEAITSVIFAAPRCSDVPELLDVKSISQQNMEKNLLPQHSSCVPVVVLAACWLKNYLQLHQMGRLNLNSIPQQEAYYGTSLTEESRVPETYTGNFSDDQNALSDQILKAAFQNPSSFHVKM